MHGQMDIFDFIGPISQEDIISTKTQFEKIFTKIDDPILHCPNCLCQYCANNAEEVWHKVKPEEVITPCFNCDTCSEYDDRKTYKIQARESCEEFVLSDYGADRKRKQFRVIK